MTQSISNEPIPCCENCDLFEMRDNVQLGEWVEVPTCGGEIISTLTPMITHRCGCLLHPQAREYLNREIVKDLEMSITDADIMGYETYEGLKLALKIVNGE